MSFGYSAGDAILLTQLAWKTVQNARKACGEHDELTREVLGLHVVIRRLEEETRRPTCPISNSHHTYEEELEVLVSGCKKNLNVLDQVLTKYNALSEQERSGRKLWQKIKFGNGRMGDLAELRAKLTYYTSAMSLFLNMVSMGAIGRVEEQLNHAGGYLKEIKIAVNQITAHFMSESRGQEGSILTAYADDDRAVWKEFRRELVQDGFSSVVIRKHKKIIKAYIEELGGRGLLDEVDPSDDAEERYHNGDLVVEGASSPFPETRSRSEASPKPQGEVESTIKAKAPLDNGTKPIASIRLQTELGDNERPINSDISKVENEIKSNRDLRWILFRTLVEEIKIPKCEHRFDIHGGIDPDKTTNNKPASSAVYESSDSDTDNSIELIVYWSSTY